MKDKITLKLILGVCLLISFTYYGYCNVRPHLVFAEDMSQLKESTAKTFEKLNNQIDIQAKENNAASREMLKMLCQERIDRAEATLKANPKDQKAREVLKTYIRKMADLEIKNK